MPCCHSNTSHGCSSSGHAHEHTKLSLYSAISAGVVLLITWISATFFGLSETGQIVGYSVAYLLGGWEATIEAFQHVRRGSFDIDTLMIVAAVGAAILGHWAEGALLLFLFSLGHALEHWALARAKKAINALADLAPETARIEENGEERMIPVEELKVGDHVVVLPGERLPADGFVIQGTSQIDQAPITGESIPVEKWPVENPEQARSAPDQIDAAHQVFAGTLNGNDALIVEVLRPAHDTTLARIAQTVAEAQQRQSPSQRFAKKFERVFVPCVLIGVGLLLCSSLVIDETFGESFYRAMAVLVAASPCALAISTPSAVLAGIARAGQQGVLVKGGQPLEFLAKLTTIVFDKTGTLTLGKPQLSEVLTLKDSTEEELLQVVQAVEIHSTHPLAKAIVKATKERLGSQSLPPAEALTNHAGLGLEAKLQGKPVWIGKPALFEKIDSRPLSDPTLEALRSLETQGYTTLAVRWDDRELGVLGLRDTPRPVSKAVIRRLREMNIQSLLLFSGDNRQTAAAIAEELGLDRGEGDMMPADKAKRVRQLAEREQVAMIGDGVNDAPAMVEAQVAIAMGAAGSDVALETADVALMGDRLERLPFIIGLSRFTMQIIRQNLWISLGVIALLVPATITGLPIGPAVVFHEGSTLVVVFNALRLLAYQGAELLPKSEPSTFSEKKTPATVA
ncbi:Heavy metal translocating P-type ATPase [Planctomycetales bacterium 10988]|nr:Heavy metal translocating P-type ATPase [Planctomycetales bacterium 10988]